MLRVGHPGQARHRLALAAGGHDQYFVVRIVIQHVHIDQVAFRNPQFPDAHGNPADIHHTAADEADAPAVPDGVVDNHLHTVDVAGEHGHDHAAGRLGKQVIKSLADLEFAHGVAGALHVGGLTQEGQDALLSVSREGLQVRDLTVNRGIVHLEVAAADDRARRAGDCNGARAGNGVADVNELAAEFAQLNGIPGLHHVHRDALHPVFLQFQIHQRHRQLGAVYMGRRLF